MKTNIIPIVNNNTYNINSLLTNLSTSNSLISTLQSKTTNLYFNSLTNTTSISGLFNFGIINSTSINNTSFVDLTNGQTIAGIKRFSANIRIDSAMLVSNGTITISNASLGYISSLTSSAQTQITSLGTRTTAVENKTAPITYTSATTTMLISGVLQFSGTLNGWNTSNFSNAINYSKDFTSSGQTQINSLQTQISNFTGVSLSASNIFTGTTNQFSNTIRLDGSLLLNAGTTTITNSTLQKIEYLSTVTSNIQDYLLSLSGKMSGFYRSETTGTYFFNSNLNTLGKFNTLTGAEIGYLTDMTENLQLAITNLKTKTDTTNINLSTTSTNANDALQRTTEISFSDTPTPQTNITNKLITEELVFTTDLNDITPTTFGYLSGVTSNIQSQLNSKTDTIPGTIIQHISANLQTTFPTRFLLCNGQSVSRTTYANLFSYIGTTYGSVDGNSFNVPNFTACFLRMASSARTVNGVVYTPEAVGTIQQDSLEAHVHSSNLSGKYLKNGTAFGSGFFNGTNNPNQNDFPNFTGGVSTSHRTSTETRPLNHSVYFYITC
jgi:microcystin-dependent protein